MTRVSDYFSLDLTQGAVDFVDVDVHGDVPVYIDPTAIRNQAGTWAEACVESLQSYFETLIKAVADDDTDALKQLIYPLVEPNETHLGESLGESRGRSLGSQAKAQELIDSLRGSKAVASGFLKDLEDSALMVDGVDKDIISDITTCVIRRHLIDYTQRQCRFHGIDMELQESGPIWDGNFGEWVHADVLLPRANDNKLLLVPKSVVRVRLASNKGRYYRGYLRPYFEDEVLANPSVGLVRVLKDKRIIVDKGALDEQLGTRKPDIVEHTRRFPQALDAYRDGRLNEDPGPLSNEELAAQIGAQVEGLRQILDEMKSILPGNAGATLYHRSVAKLMSALFARALGNERIEHGLHGGLKRIDITYDNVSRGGFFAWLGQHYSASMVVVECKNYGKDVGNPEFDQIAMRFSPQRGHVGMLACRALQDKEAALARAKVVATDDHGYVILLDDGDFAQLVDDYEATAFDPVRRLEYPLLRERFRGLVGG